MELEDQKKLHIFQMDLYHTTQISNSPAILEKYNSTLQKTIQLSEVTIHHPKDLEKVECSSKERPWKEWINEIRKFSAELNELLSRITNFYSDQVILTGKAPLSMYTYFGYLLQRGVLIMTEFNDEWQLFHVHSPSHSTVENFEKGGRILALEKMKCASEEVRVSHLSPSIAKKKLAVLFVTLNSAYYLSCDDLIEITNQCRGHHGFDGNIDEFYRLSPLDPSSPISLPPMLNNNLEEVTIFGDIREDIRIAYDAIYSADCDYDGLILISSGPQPLAYLLGMLFNSNIYGDLVLFEKCNSHFKLVL